jgi:hypothetical protein
MYTFQNTYKYIAIFLAIFSVLFSVAAIFLVIKYTIYILVPLGILYCIVGFMSLNMCISMLYNNGDTPLIFVLLLPMSTIIGYFIGIVGIWYEHALDAININNMQYVFAIYTIAYYIYVTTSYNEWKLFWNETNIPQFLSYHFLRKLTDDQDYDGSLFLLICHNNISAIFLGIAYALNNDVLIYWITTIISTLICIVVIKHKHYNDEELHTYRYIMSYFPYVLYVIFNGIISIFRLHNKDYTSKDVYHIIQFVVIMVIVITLLLFLICYKLYYIVKSCYDKHIVIHNNMDQVDLANDI